MTTLQWDAFLAHASADKGTVADELPDELIRYGLAIWYDKFEIRVADSIVRKIDEGLAHCARGIL